MLIRLPNSSLKTTKAKKRRNDLTLVTVNTRNDVDVKPGYHRGADHYLVITTFAVHRLYSLAINNTQLTPEQAVDEVMKQLCVSAPWTKVVEHGRFIDVRENGEPNMVSLVLGKHPLGLVTVNEDSPIKYRINLRDEFDRVSRTTLETVITQQLEEEITMVTQSPDDVKVDHEESCIADMKALMRQYETTLGRNLSWDEWTDLLGESFDDLCDEDEDGGANG
jgi:hypothetical protein